MPKSVPDYLATIEPALPTHGPAKKAVDLLSKELVSCEPLELMPPPQDSLGSWLARTPRKRGKIPLAIIVGESRGEARLPRNHRKENDRKMTVAGTSDGAFATPIVVGLMKSESLQPQDLALFPLVDEWPQCADIVKQSNLLIIGTGEVNLFATFLHAMVPDLSFGDRGQVPDPLSLGSVLFAGGRSFYRNPHSDTIEHYASIALLRNPWNLDYRVLWIAGLSGIATVGACQLVANDWEVSDAAQVLETRVEYKSKSLSAIAAIVRRDRHGDSGDTTDPEMWLYRQKRGPMWIPANTVAGDSTATIQLNKLWWFDESRCLASTQFSDVFMGGAVGSADAAVVKRLKPELTYSSVREIEILANLSLDQRRAIIPVLDFGQDQTRFYVVMALAEKSLFQELQRCNTFPFAGWREVLEHTLCGLEALDTVIHRDLKPANILYHEKRWKISDFGISRVVEVGTGDSTMKQCFTPRYAAPEQWSGAPHTRQIDIYALGCIAYELITGQAPFSGNIQELKEKHCCEPPPALPRTIDPKYEGAIQRMLSKDPAIRPSIHELRRVFIN